MIVPLSHYGPVTNIKFLDHDTVLAANGSNLQIYRDAQLMRTIPIFKRQRIHGIELCKDKSQLIIYGARSFTVVSVQKILSRDDVDINECGMNDWILAMSFDLTLENIYLLTSHNVAYTISIPDFKVIRTVSFWENSILYSGSIRVLEDKVIIASGTILGGVFIWDLSTGKLIHNLIGHEGAIFGVTVSPDGLYACSCSDDRSIRVWDLDTGSMLAIGWGHNARIWRLNWFNGNKIMSCSEDCTARMWSFERNPKKILYCDDVWELHQGKNVWCQDIDEQRQVAVTGGADGRIRFVDLSKLERDNSWRKQIEISVASQAPGDYFKSYAQLKHGLIVVTALGYCYKFKNFETWELIYKDETLDSFQILNVFKDENVATITSKDGETTILKFDDDFNLVKKVKLVKPESIKGKITNALTVLKSSEDFLIFFESPNPKDDFVIYQLDFDLSKELEIFYLRKPDTRFISTCLTYDKLNDWVFIGSRYTTFIIYKLGDCEKTQYWKKFVKGDTITSCSVVSSVKDEIVVLLTIRDGDYFYLKINLLFELEVLIQNKVQRGFLEGGFINEQNELILLNFKSDTFHLWNETRQIEVFKEQCGGSHRTWNLSTNNSLTQDYNFIYNKSSNLFIVNTGEQYFKDACWNSGTHGREIRDISVSESYRSDGSKFVLTASEDTMVKLSGISSSGVLSTFSSQRKHVSGLQKVKFIHKDQYLISTAGREEVFLWKITDSYPRLGPLLGCFAELPPSTSEADLRIMDFDVLPIYYDETLYGWLLMNVYSDSTIKLFEFSISSKSFRPVLEDRYSTCCLWDARLLIKSGKIYALIGATDGHIAIYDLSSDLETLYKLDEPRDSLILVEQPVFELEEGVEAEIGTKVETVPLFSDLVIKQQIHQSGIKSNVLIQHPHDSSILDLVTCGDDNALVQTRLNFINGTIELEIMKFMENAASSTITSLSAMPANDSNKRRFVAASVDQMLRLWEIDYGSTQEMECLDTEYITIGDTASSDVAVFPDHTLALVGGAGLSCLQLTNSL